MSRSKTAPRTEPRERELAAPIYGYLHEHGYEVRSEIGDCDIAAAKNDELLVIELKRRISIDLLVQATQRQRIADSVYVAVPWPPGGLGTKRFRRLSHLLRRLELGLIVVSILPAGARMEVLFHPIPFERKRDSRGRRALLLEMEGRSGDYNWAGSTRAPLVTAYRESAIFVACGLERLGPTSPARLRALGTGPKTLDILRSNYYGWYVRIARGLYALTEEGRAGLSTYAQLAARYRRILVEAETNERETPDGKAPRPEATGAKGA